MGADDGKLCGCDVVALKAEDLALNGNSVDRATVRAEEVNRLVKFDATYMSIMPQPWGSFWTVIAAPLRLGTMTPTFPFSHAGDA